MKSIRFSGDVGAHDPPAYVQPIWSDQSNSKRNPPKWIRDLGSALVRRSAVRSPSRGLDAPIPHSCDLITTCNRRRQCPLRVKCGGSLLGNEASGSPQRHRRSCSHVQISSYCRAHACRCVGGRRGCADDDRHDLGPSGRRPGATAPGRHRHGGFVRTFKASARPSRRPTATTSSPGCHRAPTR